MPALLHFLLLLQAQMGPARSVVPAAVTAPTTEDSAQRAAPPTVAAPDDHPVIISESPCPSSAAVRDALATLRPPVEWPAAVVGIRATEALMVIDVGAQDPIRRELAVGPDCAGRAGAAALVIATWMSDLPSQVTGAPALRGPVVVEAEGSKAPPPDLTAGYELGAAATGSVGGGLVPGVQLEVIRIRPTRRLGWAASAALPASRALSLGEASTHWTRMSASVGLHTRHAFAHLFVAGEVGLVAGYALAWGDGYATDARDGALVWGAAAAVRLGVPWGNARLWLELRTRRWLPGDTVEIASTSAAGPVRANLPSWDAQAALGVSYRLP